MKNISVVILAAGKSKRMKSSKSKVLHTIADRPLIDYINDIASNNSNNKVSYVCSEEVAKYIKNKSSYNFIYTRIIIFAFN